IGTHPREGRELLYLDLGGFSVGNIRQCAGDAGYGFFRAQRDLGIDFHPTKFAVAGKKARFVTTVVEFSRREAQEYLLVSLTIILVNIFEERSAQSWPHLKLGNRGPGRIEHRPIP